MQILLQLAQSQNDMRKPLGHESDHWCVGNPRSSPSSKKVWEPSKTALEHGKLQLHQYHFQTSINIPSSSSWGYFKDFLIHFFTILPEYSPQEPLLFARITSSLCLWTWLPSIDFHCILRISCRNVVGFFILYVL